MKKDDDKSKRTLSGKKPATFGGANSKLTASKPKAQSPVMVKPSPKMGKDPSGSANFNRTAPSRFTGTVGPMNLNMGGKTTAPTGGRNLTGYEEKKQSNPTAKTSSSPSSASSSAIQAQLNAIKKEDNKWNKSNTVAAAIGGTLGVGAALSSEKVRQKLAQPIKWLANTKKRKEAKRAQKAENDAMIVERNKGKATVKASKSTMKKLKGQ